MVSTASATDYYAVGMLEFIGAQWDTSYEKAKMTTSDEVNYSVTFSNVFLQSGWTYNYQVYGDGTWYPGSNQTFNVGNSGFYDVTINFVKSTETVSYSLGWIADSGSALFLRGSMISGTNSSWDNDYPQYRFIDNVATIDAKDITTDINFKFKWSNSSQFARATSGEYTVTNGIASNVAFDYYSNESGNNITIPQSTLKCDHYKITVNTSTKEFSVLGYYSKKITAANDYATFGTKVPVDLSGVSAKGVTAYTVTANATTKVITKTPKADALAAYEGVLLENLTDADVTLSIPVAASANASSSNSLVAFTGSGKLTQPMSGNETYYILTDNGDGVGFYKVNATDGNAMGANTAYLTVTGTSARSFLWFDEASGISNTVREATANDRYYNLNGQVVAQPTKGLYIVNGKKVIMK